MTPDRKLYRYTTNGEGIWAAGKRLLPENLIDEAWEQRKWMPKPQLPDGEYRFFLTEKGKEQYEKTLLHTHRKYLANIAVEEVDPMKIGSVVYEDQWQVVAQKEPEMGLKRGTVALKKHHAEWATAFEAEKQVLQKLLGNIALDIQHVGSTSIQNLSAKPIIDMLMAVRSLLDVSKIRPTLEAAGYEYRENGSNDIQVLFVKGPEERRTHYLHITPLDSPEWQNSLAFRDYLRAHPEETERYEQLKKKLAAQYPDNRAAYTAGKKDYFEEVFRKTRF